VGDKNPQLLKKNEVGKVYAFDKYYYHHHHECALLQGKIGETGQLFLEYRMAFPPRQFRKIVIFISPLGFSDIPIFVSGHQ